MRTTTTGRIASRPARLLLCSALALGALGLRASPAQARHQADTSSHAFGLGITLGAPSGLSGKYFLGDSPAALDFAAGVYSGFYWHDATELHADVLWQLALLARSRGFELPLYLGVGGRFLDHHEYTYAGRLYPAHTHVGVRVPIGIAFELNRAPLDIFVELAPVWDFIDHHGDPYPYRDDDLDLTAAFGLRYYF